MALKYRITCLFRRLWAGDFSQSASSCWLCSPKVCNIRHLCILCKVLAPAQNARCAD